MIKTRFAPSPTGQLHIGSARTALFAFLFAKHNEGEFALRIEDTDQGRSTKEFEKNILEGLDWLGINHDGEILYQSSRLEIYKSAVEKLVQNGFAVEKDGAIVLQAKEALEKLGIPLEPIKTFVGWRGEKTRENGVAYFLKNIGDDLIHGKISGAISDTVLLRSDGTPTFHLAVVIDDEEMGITHVVRGDDHLSNTPLHIILQKLFNYNIPKYAHIPMILGTDRSKLSKRHAATAVSDYKKMGYLPEALVNFMALLGWNPKDDREIFSLDDLIREFKLENVNKSGAIFDIEKLNWMNGGYIQVESPKAKVESLKDFGVDELSVGESELISRGGFKTLQEAADYITQLRKTPEYDSSLLIFKKSDKEKTNIGLKTTSEKLSNADWSEELLQKALESVVSEKNLTNGDVFWPVRVALSGAEKSPSPVELLLALGKDESIKRITKAINGLENQN
ncbi:MAG: glutamate--tRNA ligase family protein [Candidatus Berkelbacteria bacterium]|nr:glutamate--tRNA ligase family protein [Candidatus Berkelbacteria bacterium]